MIVPGSLSPLLLAMFGDPLDELGKIDRSVRFRASATASFTRVFGAPTNAKKWTFSAWVKKSRMALYQGIFDSYSNGSNFTSVMFDAADKFWLGNIAGGGTASQALSGAIYRDPASHLHVQVVFDSDNATADDRCILYVDGVRITMSGSTPLGQFSYINQAGYTHSIGRRIDANYNFDGCMSFPAFIDGQAMAPTAFGQFHPRTGQWRPKKKAATRAAVAAGGGVRNGWGANGCFLPFDDTTSPAALGLDRSQSDTATDGNNWTPNNISQTAGSTYDSSQDTPTSNYCVLNPLANAQSAPTNGCLEVSGYGTGATHGTMVVPRDFPVYFEVENLSTNHSNLSIGAGVVRANVSPSVNYEISSQPGIAGFYSSNGPYVMKDNGTSQAIAAVTTQAGDVLQVAINGNNGWVGRNDVWYDSAGGVTGNPETGENPSFTIAPSVDYVPYIHVFANTAKANFGQRAWSKTCPAGFKAISTKNLKYDTAVPTQSGTFTGNVNADGPFVQMNGCPETLTINGNAITFGVHADRLSNGFKLRTASSSHNASGSNTWTATMLTPSIKSLFRFQNTRGN